MQRVAEHTVAIDATVQGDRALVVFAEPKELATFIHVTSELVFILNSTRLLPRSLKSGGEPIGFTAKPAP